MPKPLKTITCERCHGVGRRHYELMCWICLGLGRLYVPIDWKPDDKPTTYF